MMSETIDGVEIQVGDMLRFPTERPLPFWRRMFWRFRHPFTASPQERVNGVYKITSVHTPAPGADR